MKSSFFLLMLLLPAASFSQEPAAGWFPSSPLAGSEITIWYNPAHEKASLAEGEQLYCVITNLFAESFEYTSELIPLQKATDRFQCTYRIPGKGMTLMVHFISGSGSSLDRLSLEIDLYNANGEKISGFFPGYAYRDQWFNYPFTFSVDTAVCKIREEMKTLEKYEKADPVGTAYSRSYGYIITGEESKAREIIREMVRNYPDHQLTYQAMDSYFYNVYAGKIESPAGAREIDSLMVKTVTRFPNKRFSRLYLNSNDPKSLSLQTIENICQSWMQDEPDNPLAIMRLVDRYQKEQIKPDLVLNLCDKGIDLIVDNKLRKYFDFKGVFNRRYLAYLNTVKASVLMGLGKYAEALYCIETANGFQPASHSQFLLEGKIWMALQNYSEAETAFLEALKLGNSEAETNLQKVFAIRNKSKISFNEYLADKFAARASNAKSTKPQAKDFSLTTINGEKLTLSSLRGKVVLINFWNLGCGPCRAEMPQLNKLVEKYTGQNVVFIAISNDQKGKIQKFLEQKEFKYLQVADANVLFKDYEVKVLPTHIIINKDGSVYNRMIGGGKDIFELLDNQIKLLD